MHLTLNSYLPSSHPVLTDYLSSSNYCHRSCKHLHLLKLTFIIKYLFPLKKNSVSPRTYCRAVHVCGECSTRNTSLGGVCTRVVYPVSSPPTPLLVRGLNGCTDMVGKSYRQRNRKYKLLVNWTRDKGANGASVISTRAPPALSCCSTWICIPWIDQLK